MIRKISIFVMLNLSRLWGCVKNHKADWTNFEFNWCLISRRFEAAEKKLEKWKKSDCISLKRTFHFWTYSFILFGGTKFDTFFWCVKRQSVYFRATTMINIWIFHKSLIWKWIDAPRKWQMQSNLNIFCCECLPVW